jgi:ectoine hydroxylase-related dioxygenase (phytanoyl-CoA dioxygenase family)
MWSSLGTVSKTANKWPLKPDTGRTGDISNAAHAVLSPEEITAFETAVPVELPRGVANFHHSMMMHGSYINHSDRPRRAAVISVFEDGVVSSKPLQFW